jgi:hypothetical protein
MSNLSNLSNSKPDPDPDPKICIYHSDLSFFNNFSSIITNSQNWIQYNIWNHFYYRNTDRCGVSK